MLGITFSSVEDLATWRSQVGLESDLLSDSSREVGLAYGAAADVTQEKATRVSVLINADGCVEKVYVSPDPANHADAVLADL